MTPHDAPPQRPARFTLIELLVVVAIIAVLAAMLLPTLTQARRLHRKRQATRPGLHHVQRRS